MDCMPRADPSNRDVLCEGLLNPVERELCNRAVKAIAEWERLIVDMNVET